MKKVSIKPLFESAINEAPVTNSPQAFLNSARNDIMEFERAVGEKYKELGKNLGKLAVKVSASGGGSRESSLDFLKTNLLALTDLTAYNKRRFNEGFDEGASGAGNHPPFGADERSESLVREDNQMSLDDFEDKLYSDPAKEVNINPKKTFKKKVPNKKYTIKVYGLSHDRSPQILSSLENVPKSRVLDVSTKLFDKAKSEDVGMEHEQIIVQVNGQTILSTEHNK